ncbi:hypothetical protein [Bradyrhizobium sp. LA2.1]|uniref:hypothetical protein n=1 Tax=Bradyrhizobium sp. LA2.1 TaxID=3156376 RepID=UPI0033997855
MTDEATFESLLECDFRWPRLGDKAFTESGDPQANAYVHRHGHGRFVMMMSGYKKGADLMVERSLHSDVDRDSLVFPVVFNYRQFLELSLKYFIAMYGYTVGVAPNWKTHDLGVLWKAFCDVLKLYGHDQNDADQVVTEIVAEFAKMDPASFSYRYPVDTKGRAIPIAHQQLNLSTLAEVMGAAQNYFTGCDGYLSHLQSAGP